MVVAQRSTWQATGLRLYHRHRVIGRDDHLLYAGDVVFVVDDTAYELPTPIQEVEYFHGMIDGYCIICIYINIYT
jgi:hypothetical protein